MTDMVDIDPQRITRAMRDNVEALSSTADMIDVLVSEAEKAIHRLQLHFEQRAASSFDDWRIIQTFLRLAAAQAEIVKDTADAFEKQTVEVAA